MQEIGSTVTQLICTMSMSPEVNGKLHNWLFMDLCDMVIEINLIERATSVEY